MTEHERVICAAQDCDNPVPERSVRGRPFIYCTPACRPSAQQHIHRLGVHIDHEITESGERPSGRVWSVALRRGAKSVIVASALGRPSAEHLAAQISDLLTAHPSTQGVAID
jgi:hypothetical protein